MKAAAFLYKDKIKEGSLVWDMVTDKNGIILSINPVVIQLDDKEGSLVERNHRQFMLYLYDEDDLEKINKLVDRFKKLF